MIILVIHASRQYQCQRAWPERFAQPLSVGGNIACPLIEIACAPDVDYERVIGRPTFDGEDPGNSRYLPGGAS
jgi:hypothetical protein